MHKHADENKLYESLFQIGTEWLALVERTYDRKFKTGCVVAFISIVGFLYFFESPEEWTWLWGIQCLFVACIGFTAGMGVYMLVALTSFDNERRMLRARIVKAVYDYRRVYGKEDALLHLLAYHSQSPKLKDLFYRIGEEKYGDSETQSLSAELLRGIEKYKLQPHAPKS